MWTHQEVKLRLFRYTRGDIWKISSWVFQKSKQNPFLSFSSSVFIQSARLCPSLCIFPTEPVRSVRRSGSQLHEHRTPLAGPVLQPHSQSNSGFGSGSSRPRSTAGGCRFPHRSVFQTTTKRRWGWIKHSFKACCVGDLIKMFCFHEDNMMDHVILSFSHFTDSDCGLKLGISSPQNSQFSLQLTVVYIVIYIQMLTGKLALWPDWKLLI